MIRAPEDLAERLARQDTFEDPRAQRRRLRRKTPAIALAAALICGAASAARDPALWPDWPTLEARAGATAELDLAPAGPPIDAARAPDHGFETEFDKRAVGRSSDLRRIAAQRAPDPKPVEAAFVVRNGDAPVQAAPRPLPPATPDWRIERAEWTAADEAGFEAFVRRIGESDCATLHACLSDPEVNPGFHDAHPPGFEFEADCADLPYLLRAYYAWRSRLPFSYASGFAALPVPPTAEIAVSPTMMTERRDVVGPTPAPAAVFADIRNTIWTAHFRTPATPDVDAPEGAQPTDAYPVAITRETLRPGAMLFSATGHVAIVFDVTWDGRIRLLDANPDMLLSRRDYGPTYRRDHPALGAGFTRWRPQRLVGAEPDAEGVLIGGRIELAPDAEAPGWSDEQHLGTVRTAPDAWAGARFEIAGAPVSFPDFVRRRLAVPGFAFRPEPELRRTVRDLCDQVRARVAAVDAAAAAGLADRPAPARLPGNVYVADGDWERYATPARDLRLRLGLLALREQAAQFLNMAWSGDPALLAPAGDLRAVLRAAYAEETAACTVAYRRSDGGVERLTLETVIDRAFDLSFDPHHCPERRWGAPGGAELESCPDGAEKAAWYAAQAPLRRSLAPAYDVEMGWTLSELRTIGARAPWSAPAPEIGLATVLAPVE